MPKTKKAAVAAFTNAFIGAAKSPSATELTAALGKAGALWNELLERFSKELELSSQEWKSYSSKSGWVLRLKNKDRNIVYLSPGPDAFRVSFALGEKAMKKASQEKLLAPIEKVLKNAPRYVEGAAVNLDLPGGADVAVIVKLAEIKLGN